MNPRTNGQPPFFFPPASLGNQLDRACGFGSGRRGSWSDIRIGTMVSSPRTGGRLGNGQWTVVNEHLGEGENSQYEDIQPIGGRLVIFNSRLLPHEVLPATSSRFAISLWICK